MSYAPGTVLERVEQFEKDNESEAYNLVRVVGPSPVSSGVQQGEWVGQQGQDFTISPHGDVFGAAIARPLGELERDYSIVSVPGSDEKPTATPQADPSLSPFSANEQLRRAELA